MNNLELLTTELALEQVVSNELLLEQVGTHQLTTELQTFLCLDLVDCEPSIY